MADRLENLLARLRFLPVLVLAAAIALVWGVTLSYDFVWDDRFFIVENRALAGPERVPDMFTREDAQAATSPEYPSWGVYRPLRLLHHAVLVWGLGRPIPAVFHAVNIAWHLLACCLLYLLAVRLLGPSPLTRPLQRTAALGAAVGLAVHPVASEVVAWAKCLDDLMAAALVLGAVLAAWQAWRTEEGLNVRWAVLSVLLHAAALLCKESVVGLFPLFLFPLLFGPVRKRPFAAWIAAQAACPLLFIVARHGVLHSTAQVAKPLSGSYGQTLLDMLPVALLYGRTTLGLPPFLPDYSFMRGGVSLLSPATLGGVLLLLVAAGLFVWALRRRAVHAAVAFGLGWAGLALLPVSNLVPMMQYFAERFVYLPLVGMLLAAAGAGTALAVRRPQLVPLAALVLAAWAGVAVAERGKWQNEATLVGHTYRNAPPSKRIVSNYLVVLDRAAADGEIDAVLARHAAMLRTGPELQWLVGKIRMRQGRLEEARRSLEGVSAALAENPEYLLDCGILDARTGDPARARRAFSQVTRKWPSVPRGWTCLGLSFNESGEHAAAIPAFETAGRLAPNDAHAWKGLARAGLKLRDWRAARVALAHLARLEPANEAHARLLQQVPAVP